MTERVLGPTGSPRRRRTLLLPLVAVLALGLIFVAGAQAVHDETFQLDGNVIATDVTNIDGKTQNVDWASIFTSAGANQNPLPTGFDAASFRKDFNNIGSTFQTNDPTTFATGSKDTLPIADWQCNLDNNVNSKIDVMNAYAASYTASNGDEILYFALERNVNTGDANVGFWFLQGAVGCSSTGAAADFTGGHQDGDLLVVSEFSGGGDVSTINAYRWNGDDATGSLGTVPVASGADCRGDSVDPDDRICGAANTVPITTPWQTAAKTTIGNSLPIAQFFEGGINLTDSNLGGKCFNSFLGDTRSSTSLTATLFDFAGGQLGACTSGIVTTPQTGAGANLTSTPIGTSARVDVRDHAEITVTGASTFGGTVKFFLCGPLAAASTENCSTGGVQIGSPAGGESVSGSNGTASLNSDTATLTSAGRYCWRAEYSGDAGVGVPASKDPSRSVADGGTTSECFTINPVTPTLTTTAGPDVVLGNPITDTASLTGTAKQPGTDGLGPGGTINATAGTQANAGGTITFSVNGPNGCTASGLTVTGSPVTVNGDNASYGPVSATPTAVGTYVFVAQYSGSSPNTLGAGPSGCPEASETVVVTGNATSSSAQRWLPNDRITISGDTNLNGTLTVTLYSGNNCGVTSGSAISGQQYSTTFTNATSPQVFNTSNTTFFVGTKPDGTAGSAAGAYSWLVHYDDSTLVDPADRCETSNVSITD